MKTTKASEEFAIGEHNIGWISNTIQELVKKQPLGTKTILPYQTLSKYSPNVVKEFNMKECSWGDILATIDASNEVMKDGYGNFFLCGSVLVGVSWGDVYRYWGVGDWYPGGGVYAGRRVFSGNLPLSTSDSDTLTLESLDVRLKKLEALVNPQLLKNK